jgi:hypothetical protein
MKLIYIYIVQRKSAVTTAASRPIRVIEKCSIELDCLAVTTNHGCLVVRIDHICLAVQTAHDCLALTIYHGRLVVTIVDGALLRNVDSTLDLLVRTSIVVRSRRVGDIFKLVNLVHSLGLLDR